MRWYAFLIVIICLALAGCVSLPKITPVQVITACPGNLSADLIPMPAVPANAGFPAPQTQEASDATKAYLTWLKSLADWGRTGWQRASDAKDFCTKK